MILKNSILQLYRLDQGYGPNFSNSILEKILGCQRVPSSQTRHRYIERSRLKSHNFTKKMLIRNDGC